MAGNKNSGRKGYGLEERERKLRLLALEKAEEILTGDPLKSLMQPQVFETFQTVLKRALKQRTELTGANDGPVKVEIVKFGDKDTLDVDR